MRPWRHHRLQRSPERVDGGVQMHRLALWHVPLLRRLGRGVDVLGLPFEFGPSAPRMLLVNGLRRRRGGLLLAARVRGAGTGLVQVVAEPGPDHWLITRFVAAPEPRTSDQIAFWEAILEETVRLAGSSGVKRLHVLLPSSGPVNEAFQRAGFKPFRTLTLMRGARRVGEGLERATVRVQSSHDTWAVMRLYERVTPRPVVYAESRSRVSWQPGRRAGWCVSGYLLRDGEHPVAFCQVRARHGQSLVEVLAEPQVMGAVPGLVTAALEHAGVHECDQVWALVPDDVTGLRQQFEALGFEAVESRVWAARYTVRRLRARASRKAAFRELREVVKAGVPVYSRMRGETRPVVDVTTD